MGTYDDKLAERIGVQLEKPEKPTKLSPGNAAAERRKLTEVWLTKQAKAQAKAAAELESFVQYHREHADGILAAKIGILKGLLSEMTVYGPDGQPQLDTKLLDTPRLKMLHDWIVQWENRGFGSYTQRVEKSDKKDLLAEFMAMGDEDPEDE